MAEKDIAIVGTQALGLGIDAGGTQTRWALADASGAVIASGAVAGLSGMQMHSQTGRAEVAATLAVLANAIKAGGAARPICAIVAGATGIGAGNVELAQLMGAVFGVPDERVSLRSDIEVAYRAIFGSEQAYLVYAGTGSIAAFIDDAGVLHRAGGRGVMLDDAGGGYWIAREALRRIWRREDETPGAWQQSPMADALFTKVGGDSSIFSARYLTERSRGEVGALAMIVAACADADALALQILCDAGAELGRLGNAMTLRYGARPIVLSGRCATLHPCIEEHMRLVLPPGAKMEMRQVEAHIAAAQRAAAQ